MVSRREQQADQTRRDILSAARRLFVANGYKATRIADIATEANVSPQTIYDSVGSKAKIAASLMDGMEQEVRLHEVIPLIMEGTDPRAVIAAQLELTKRFAGLAGDMLRALDEGGDPELRAIREEGRRRHRAGCGMTIARLDQLGALQEGAEHGRLADLMAALSDGDAALTLVDRFGWELDDAIAALRRIVERELLDD